MVQSKEKIVEKFKDGSFKEFEELTRTVDSDKILFKYGASNDLVIRDFAQQVVLRRKAKNKLPSYVDKFCFLTARSYEQCSSESTASYKASRFSGSGLLDLCGGLGVDDWAFASTFKKVVSLDTDEDLNEKARHNFEQLGVNNVIRITGSAEAYALGNKEKYDLVYVDADRRPEGKRQNGLEETVPNILPLLPVISSFAPGVLIKASPMADVDACLQQLTEVRTIEVVSVNNEVKELLIQVEFGYTGEPLFMATDLDDAGKIISSFEGYMTSRSYTPEFLTETAAYLYEPGLSLIKSGLSQAYAHSLLSTLKQVGVNSYLFEGTVYVESFFGRSFKIVHQMEYSAKKIGLYCQKLGIKKANITKRNFPDTVALLRKRLKLNDGGEDYFFFTTRAQRHYMYHCVRT